MTPPPPFDKAPPTAPARAVATAAAHAPAIASERLFAGAQEVLIDHRGVLYRLRQTALGKLILTK